jgi:hypothetical protein
VVLAALTVIATLMGVGTARAQAPSRLEMELALGVSGSTELRSVILMSPLFELSAPVSAESAFVAQWGFSLATGDPTNTAFDSTFAAPGNLLFGWSLRLAEGLVVTPSVALPIATMPNSEARRPAAGFAYAGALGLRGGLDRWLWLPDRISIVVPVALVLWFDPILIESHFKLGFLFPTVSEPLAAVPANGRSSEDVDEFAIQSQVRVAARVGDGIWVATRFSMVYVPTSANDNVELALSPEVRVMLAPYSHVEVSLTMNLDGPLGPFWEPGRFWAVVIGGSTAL